MLGCGEVGRELLKREPHFRVVDKDVVREGYDDVKGDPTDREVLKKAEIEKAEIVVILEKNSLFSLVRNLNPDAFVIVYEKDRKMQNMCMGKGLIIPTDEAVADECLTQIRRFEKLKRKERLERVLRSGKTMAIIMHDNPDPDCISSALSLKKIGEKIGVDSDLFYGGQIGYSENWVLVELLETELISPGTKPDFANYDITAFIDHSPWYYTSIARNVNPDIVIDHHIPPEYEGRFVDVRENAGSTATILTEYLQLFGVDIDSKLATGLFYALLVDTNSFRRGICELDIEALRVLRKKVDTDLLSQVERARFSKALEKGREPSDFLNILGDAVKNMQMRDDVLFSYVGKVKHRDAVSNSADFLLKMERVKVVLVYGIVGDTMYISARSWDEKLHVGELLREAFHELGRAGGHPLAGGASISVGKLPENFKEEIVERFLKVMRKS